LSLGPKAGGLNVKAWQQMQQYYPTLIQYTELFKNDKKNILSLCHCLHVFA
jgi:hypothetical protein